MIAGLTWGELDRLVDEDPIALRDRAWEEIQELRAENQRLRADLVDGVGEVDELRAENARLHSRVSDLAERVVDLGDALMEANEEVSS